MATKVKGEAIKEGSIPLSALADDVKNKIENAGADWGADKGKAGYISNKTHSASFNRIQYDQENNMGKYEVANTQDKLVLLWREKYFTVYKNKELFIDIYDGEDTFIVDYNGVTLFITDNNGYLQNEYEYISVSEINIPLEEVFIPDTVLKTTPQTLSDTDKNQALANLGIDPVVWKYVCNPHIMIYESYSGTWNNPIPKELSDIIYQNNKFNHLVLSTILVREFNSDDSSGEVKRMTSYTAVGSVYFEDSEFYYDPDTRLFVV